MVLGVSSASKKFFVASKKICNKTYMHSHSTTRLVQQKQHRYDIQLIFFLEMKLSELKKEKVGMENIGLPPN